MVKERIMADTKIKKINIDKLSINTFRLSLGPYKSLKNLRKDFEDMEDYILKI